MPFIDRFELLNLVHFDVVETWATRESGSGRNLLLHRYPKTSGLRERLQLMPLEELSMILTAGEDGDYFFVVTPDAPEFRRFLNWVGRFSAPQTAAPVVTFSEPPTAPAAEPGEFTGMFRTAPPVPSAAKPIGEPSQKSAAEPGEFTRMFKGPAVPPQRPAPPSSAPEPGEFTKLFKSPVPAPPAARLEKPQPPKPPAPAAEPGEFTQMFGRINRPSPPPDANANPSPAPKPAAEPGELTRLFKGPSTTPQRPSPPAGAQQAGEFTALFNNPLRETPLAAKLEAPPADIKPAPSFNEPGDFTKMFGRPGQISPERPAPANFSGPAALPGDLGAASGIFSKKNIFEAASPQAPVAAGPSEYTRLFQPAGSAQAAPAQPEQKPASAPPPAAKKQTPAIPIALIVILAAIAVVAIALILYFVLKR